MNKKILSAIFAFAVCMSSCNYLDYNESSGFDKEDMFTYFERAKGMLTTVYSYLPADFGNFDGPGQRRLMKRNMPGIHRASSGIITVRGVRS